MSDRPLNISRSNSLPNPMQPGNSPFPITTTSNSRELGVDKSVLNQPAQSVIMDRPPSSPLTNQLQRRTSSLNGSASNRQLIEDGASSISGSDFKSAHSSSGFESAHSSSGFESAHSSSVFESGLEEPNIEQVDLREETGSNITNPRQLKSKFDDLDQFEDENTSQSKEITSQDLIMRLAGRLDYLKEIEINLPNDTISRAQALVELNKGYREALVMTLKENPEFKSWLEEEFSREVRKESSLFRAPFSQILSNNDFVELKNFAERKENLEVFKQTIISKPFLSELKRLFALYPNIANDLINNKGLASLSNSDEPEMTSVNRYLEVLAKLKNNAELNLDDVVGELRVLANSFTNPEPWQKIQTHLLEGEHPELLRALFIPHSQELSEDLPTSLGCSYVINLHRKGEDPLLVNTNFIPELNTIAKEFLIHYQNESWNEMFNGKLKQLSLENFNHHTYRKFNAYLENQRMLIEGSNQQRTDAAQHTFSLVNTLLESNFNQSLSRLLLDPERFIHAREVVESDFFPKNQMPSEKNLFLLQQALHNLDYIDVKKELLQYVASNSFPDKEASVFKLLLEKSPIDVHTLHGEIVKLNLSEKELKETIGVALDHLLNAEQQSLQKNFIESFIRSSDKGVNHFFYYNQNQITPDALRKDLMRLEPAFMENPGIFTSFFDAQGEASGYSNHITSEIKALFGQYPTPTLTTPDRIQAYEQACSNKFEQLFIYEPHNFSYLIDLIADEDTILKETGLDQFIQEKLKGSTVTERTRFAQQPCYADNLFKTVFMNTAVLNQWQNVLSGTDETLKTALTEAYNSPISSPAFKKFIALSMPNKFGSTWSPEDALQCLQEFSKKDWIELQRYLPEDNKLIDLMYMHRGSHGETHPSRLTFYWLQNQPAESSTLPPILEHIKANLAPKFGVQFLHKYLEIEKLSSANTGKVPADEVPAAQTSLTLEQAKSQTRSLSRIFNHLSAHPRALVAAGGLLTMLSGLIPLLTILIRKSQTQPAEDAADLATTYEDMTPEGQAALDNAKEIFEEDTRNNNGYNLSHVSTNQFFDATNEGIQPSGSAYAYFDMLAEIENLKSEYPELADVSASHEDLLRKEQELIEQFKANPDQPPLNCIFTLETGEVDRLSRRGAVEHYIKASATLDLLREQLSLESSTATSQTHSAGEVASILATTLGGTAAIGGTVASLFNRSRRNKTNK